MSQGDNINVDENSKFILLEKYGQMSPNCKENLKNIECDSPINILSENATPFDVLEMAKQIQKAQDFGFDGIVLTHGSDTLAYSSAFLSMLLYDLKVPVVMVASNLILTNEKANGVINFAAAIDLIKSDNIKPAIYVAYKNPEEDFVSIHLGSRMKEPMPYSESFYSPIGYRFATWKDWKLKFENINFNRTDKNFKFEGEFNKQLLYIHPYNGLNYDIYKNGNYDIVLHNLYHSGTANTKNVDGEKYNTDILNFINYCNIKNIPFYLCNIEKKDVNYNSTNILSKQNVKFLFNTLPNVAIAKLLIAYNLIDKSHIDEFLDTNISGEILN